MSTNTTTNGTPDPWQAKELGVLWKRVKQGTNDAYLTGTLNIKKLIDQGIDPSADIALVIFPNKSKKKDTHPDLRIYVSEKRASTATAQKTTAAAPAKKAAPAPTAKPAAPAPDANDLI